LNRSSIYYCSHNDAQPVIPEFNVGYWNGKTTRYCLVIPVINEGDRLQKLIRRMDALAVRNLVDIIITDGGSTDDSLRMSELQDLGVTGLLVKQDAGGLSSQLRIAYWFALDKGYDGIVTIDGNNKDDPQFIEKFVKHLESGYDFVQASRYIPGGAGLNTPKMREIAIRCVHVPLLRWFSGFEWTDTTQGFRAYSSRMLRDPRIGVFREVFSGYELLAYLTYSAPRFRYRCVELPTVRRYPVGKTPTKIKGLSGMLGVLGVLFATCAGRYNVRDITTKTRGQN